MTLQGLEVVVGGGGEEQNSRDVEWKGRGAKDSRHVKSHRQMVIPDRW
jgi:hypothetical protein